ncbi:hypothetical protein pb186bvf_011602 [Paramecium bursaria]
MGCMNIGKKSATIEPQKAQNSIPKQNKILNHSTTQNKIAQKILAGLEDKNGQADDQIEMEKHMYHKKNQEQKTYQQKRDLFHKQILELKYPPNSQIKTDLKHQLPKHSNLQSKAYLRDVKEELIFVESNRVGIIQTNDVIYDGYCNKQLYDGFGMIIDGTTHKIGSFFERVQMYGQGLYTNEIIFQLGKFRDFRLQGYGVYYKYVQEKKQKIYKGQFLQDELDPDFPNHLVKYIKLQKYFGFTLNNRINNFGFSYEKNQISQFVYHKDHKQLKISNLNHMYQNLSFIELFKVWTKRIQNLILLILNIKDLQEENKLTNELQKLKDGLDEFWKNQQEVKFKRKKYIILSAWREIIMKQYINSGSFIIFHDDTKIYIKIESEIITECIISDLFNFKNELDFKIQGYTIRLKQNKYLYFGNYTENEENGEFQQFSLTNPQINLKDILDGETQLKLPICEKFYYSYGKPIRIDQSSLEFEEASNYNFVSYFKEHQQYTNLDQKFQLIIEQIIKKVSQFKTYLLDGVYYKGQWKDGKFNGIGIKYNQKLNSFNLGMFEQNYQTSYGYQIETQNEKLIVELSEFIQDKKCDICKIQELSHEEQLVLYVNKQQDVKQNEGLMIADNKKFIIHYKDDIHFYKESGEVYLPCGYYENKDVSLNTPFSDDRKKKYDQFIKILSQEEQIINLLTYYDNFKTYNLFGRQMQGKILEKFDIQEFGRSMKQDPFQMYEGMFLRGKRRGFGKLLVFEDTFQLHIGIFDEAKNQQQIFLKIIEEYQQKADDPSKDSQKNQDQIKLKYEIINNYYLYNMPEINSKEILKEYEKKFDFTKLTEFVIKPENEQRIQNFKPILRTAENDLVFLKTQSTDQVIKLRKNNSQSQYQGEIELNEEITGYVVINNEQEDSLSSGYIYQNKLINTYLHLTTSRIYKQQEDLIYKSIQAKQSFIQQIDDDGITYTLKHRKYPHKFKYLLKLKDNQNEFGATFHENGLCQYFQQINKTKVYPSNGQVNYNFKKTQIKEQKDPYEVLAQIDEFQQSLFDWINEIKDSTDPILPVILKPSNQYYFNKRRGTSRRFWNKCKSLTCERLNNIILIRMVAQVSIHQQLIYVSKFQLRFNKKKQFIYRLRNDVNKLQIYPLHSIHLDGYIPLDSDQFSNLEQIIDKDSRLKKYFNKVRGKIIDLEKQMKLNESQKVYIHINKQDQKALIINDDYIYFGQYDEITPNGYGFAYHIKDNYKYKGQWVKGQKEGWGYVTYFYDRDLRNKLAKEKQFDLFNQDIAENLPDLSVYQQIKFPLIDLSAQQIEFIKNCKKIYFSQVEELKLENDKFKQIRSIDQLLSMRNFKDESSFMQDYETNCFIEFKYVAFKNRLAGSIYLGNWSKQSMHGFGKIVYSSDNFYSGYFKYGQRDFRGLYLKNTRKRIDESFYIGFWKEDKQDSNYYQEKSLNKQSLLANQKDFYIGEFKQDQQDGAAKIFDFKALSQEQQPTSEIKQFFKIQVDSKNFNTDMIYMGDSDQQIQPTPSLSESVIKLMEEKFKLKIQKKQNIQKDVHSIVKQELAYCPLYFKVQLFGQEFFYKGQWKGQQPNGEGHALNQNTFIQGTFVDGQMTYGYYVCVHNQYLGHFQDSKMQGEGEYYNNTIYYKGQFVQGVFHGEGKLKFQDQNIKQIQSGKWENGLQKVENSQKNELPLGTAIKHTIRIDQKFIDIAKSYNYVIENQIDGYKYVQNEDFYSGEIDGQYKKVKDNILYYGQFRDQFTQGLIITEDLVQIISYVNLNQSKMLEYKLDDSSYQFHGNCKFMESTGKTDGCLIQNNEKYVGSFQNGKKYKGKLIYDYGCIIDLIYDENESVKEIVKIQYQINPYMRNIMNKFNLYSINVIDNPEYSLYKFDQVEYFSLEDPNGNERILINKDKIIYQYISDKTAYYMREYDLKNKTFYLGRVRKDQKSADQAIYYDQALDELYFGGYEEGKREGNGRIIKENQIKVGAFKEDELKSGKIYNSDGSYFKITQDKNKVIKPMIYHLGNLDARWSEIDNKMKNLEEDLKKEEELEGYLEYLKQKGQDTSLEIFNKMKTNWSECKESIKKMNSKGCKLVEEQSKIVPVTDDSCLIILNDFTITHYLNFVKDDKVYFGCCQQNNQLVLGYFNSSYNITNEVIIFQQDGSVLFKQASGRARNQFIRFFKYQPIHNKELQKLQNQLEQVKKKHLTQQQNTQLQQAEEKIIDQLQDVIESNNNFFRNYSSLIYKGSMNSDNVANGNGEAYREDYYFKGYRSNGDRRFGEVYEEKNFLYYGELDGNIDGFGIQIRLENQYIGYLKNDSYNGKGKLIQNGIIIEASFEQDRIKSVINVKFDNENFRPYILYEKIQGFITYDIQFQQFNKEIELFNGDIHRIYQNKGDIIFKNGDYQWGTFDLGILQEGLYYNKNEDKIYLGQFELGFINVEQGFTFDGKILIKGKFDHGIMNGPQVITWFSETMEQLSKLEAVFQNGNPIKVSEFKPKKWQEILMDKKEIKYPYQIDVNSRFLVFQLKDQETYKYIYLDVFQNELLYKNEDDRILINYEYGKVQELEILNSDSFFYQIVMKEKIYEDQNLKIEEYTGPGFFNMKHSENKNQGHKYKYDKLWYEEKIYNYNTGKYEIQLKYVFGKLIRDNQGDQQEKVEIDDKEIKQQEQQQKYNKYQLAPNDEKLNEYDQKIQTYLNSLGEILSEQIKKQEDMDQNINDEMNQNIPIVNLNETVQIQYEPQEQQGEQDQ